MLITKIASKSNCNTIKASRAGESNKGEINYLILNMSKADVEKATELIRKTEEVADKILSNQIELLELDKRRQSTREAIRLIEKSTEEKTWITVGSMLIKMKSDKALELLKADQKQIDREMNIINSDQRVLVNEHRQLELRAPFSGSTLKPLDRKEIGALKKNLPTMLQ